ncbi:hypothetical protein J2T12_000921 [Paenibacillus anaericanus]|nr:hypothetical protein [Paenibacillus anaericanus]
MIGTKSAALIFVLVVGGFDAYEVSFAPQNFKEERL